MRSITAWVRPRILLLSCGTASGSPVSTVAGRLAGQLAGRNAEIAWASLADHRLPLHEPDGTARPAAVDRLGRLVAAHDGLALVIPAVNASLSAPAKNALDWLGDVRPHDGGPPRRPVLDGRIVGVVSLAADHAAASIALGHAYAILARLGADFLPDQHGIALQASAPDGAPDALGGEDEALIGGFCAGLVERCGMTAPAPGAARR